MSSCCCFLPKQVFLVQTARTRGRLSGSPSHGHSHSSRSGGSIFLIISWSSFLTQILRWTHNDVFGSYFSETMLTWKKCVCTAPARTDCIWAHPLECSGWPKDWRKKASYFRTALFSKNNGNIQKKSSKRSPKGWGDFGANASWATFGAPSWFLMQKVSPQRPQSAPRDPNMLQKWSQKGQKWS